MSGSNLIKAVLFRSQYRGGKEADTIIGGFARQYVDQLDDDELRSLGELLNYDDHQIMTWIEFPDHQPGQFSKSLLVKMHNHATSLIPHSKGEN